MTLAYERQGTSTSVYDPEFTTSVFLTRRTLDAANRTYSFNGHDSVIGDGEASDEEWAYRIQSEYLANALQMIEDARIAKMLDEGVEVDHPILNAIPIAAEIVHTSSTSIAPQPIIPLSPAEDYTELLIDSTPTGSLRDYIDPPVISRSPTPELTSSSSCDTLVSSQDDARLTGEKIQKNKGKEIYISNGPDGIPFCDDEDLPETPSDKGKGRSFVKDVISDDEEYALKVQAEDLQNALQVMEDAQFAKALDEGAEAKHPSLRQTSYTNQVAIALRQAALSVAAKKGLPGPSSLPHEPELPLSFIPPVSVDTLQAVDNHKFFVSRFLTPEHVSGLGTASNVLYPYTERPKSPANPVPATPKQDGESLPSTTQSSPQSLCIICEEVVTSADVIHTACDHDYCKDCINSYVDASTRDNSLLPVRCCNIPIPKEAIVPFLTNALLTFFEDKSRELEIPVNHRIYCQSPGCSTFLGSIQRLEGNVACPKCGSSTCASCKQSSHVGESCSDNVGILEVKALARVEHWQTCPGCNAIVELQQGCYHMTCRCATQFCYLCAAPWKGCSCPQWEERRL